MTHRVQDPSGFVGGVAMSTDTIAPPIERIYIFEGLDLDFWEVGGGEQWFLREKEDKGFLREKRQAHPGGGGTKAIRRI
ncbi:hypothetical protein TSUD_291980 [Trifolium subterraneum]|uniref:Uncharacterized protein n=1 Tax=Trifolium subterraneum TaxID=3900 RepID=A0A2Z6P910_TRISU|nr:hypothetical protein TSUD_291980 [Trifolium subterraneum]